MRPTSASQASWHTVAELLYGEAHRLCCPGCWCTTNYSITDGTEVVVDAGLALVAAEHC